MDDIARLFEKLEDHQKILERITVGLQGLGGNNGIIGDIKHIRKNEGKLFDKLDSLPEFVIEQIGKHVDKYHPEGKNESRERMKTIFTFSAIFISITALAIKFVL